MFLQCINSDLKGTPFSTLNISETAQDTDSPIVPAEY